MKAHSPVGPKLTICVLTFGDYPRLARQTLDSILRHCPRPAYQLVAGANAVGPETLHGLEALKVSGAIDRLIISPINLSKCPMMQQMLAGIETEFVWWFDDDSYIVEPTALTHWLQPALSAPASTVMWGQLGWCDSTESFTNLEDALGFVRSAAWYRGLPPPSWRPGGKGEFNFQNLGCGDGRWFFIFGGCWLIRTRALHDLDWPDRRLIQLGDDVFLGEAIRQNGWDLANLGTPGVALNTEPRRGSVGC